MKNTHKVVQIITNFPFPMKYGSLKQCEDYFNKLNNKVDVCIEPMNELELKLYPENKRKLRCQHCGSNSKVEKRVFQNGMGGAFARLCDSCFVDWCYEMMD